MTIKASVMNDDLAASVRHLMLHLDEMHADAPFLAIDELTGIAIELGNTALAVLAGHVADEDRRTIHGSIPALLHAIDRVREQSRVERETLRRQAALRRQIVATINDILAAEEAS